MKTIRVWSIETIRKTAIANGGVPAVPVSIFNADRHLVVWKPTGEVRTLRLDDEVIGMEIIA